MGKYKVVIIDDQPIMRKILNITLSKHNFEVTEAGDGKEGLEKIKEIQPDVALVDIMMPEVNGYQILHAVKADPELKKTKIVMLSAKGLQTDIDKALKLGADDYFVKPFKPHNIIEALTHLLEDHHE